MTFWPDTFPTALNFKGSEEFQSHLSSKAKEIKSKLNSLFTTLASARGKQPADLGDLQSKLTKLLASQKEYVVKVDRLRTEKEELTERLEVASLRYIKAEKKLDRAKSTAVQKLEAQAIASSTNGASGHTDNGDVEMTNGIPEHSEASQTALKEAQAVVAKQKEQLDTISEENKSLTEQLTALNTRLTSLTEDDFARTELFKQFRVQHEDVIRRINHLEATNIQLREEAEKYQAERTAFRTQVETESEIVTGELESQLQRVESDLSRIRSARDELIADVATRKTAQEHERTSVEQLKELVAAKDDHISSLELAAERLQAHIDGESCTPTPRSDIDSLSTEELRRKYETLEKEFDAINKESTLR